MKTLLGHVNGVKIACANGSYDGFALNTAVLKHDDKILCAIHVERALCVTGARQADINIAEGKKRARVLTSEAYKTEKVNQASGEADAILAKAEAQAEAIKRVAQALESKVSLVRAWNCVRLRSLPVAAELSASGREVRVAA